MIDRPQVRVKLSRALQTEYVALLGQRGIGVKTSINAIINKSPLFPGMKFISVYIPRIQYLDEFKEL